MFLNELLILSVSSFFTIFFVLFWSVLSYRVSIYEIDLYVVINGLSYELVFVFINFWLFSPILLFNYYIFETIVFCFDLVLLFKLFLTVNF